MNKLFTTLKTEPQALSNSAVEEVRRHPASYAEQNLVATIDKLREELEQSEALRKLRCENSAREETNLKRHLQQEQETIRALEAVAVKHRYDMETGECLTDWLSGLVVQRDTARAAADHWKRKYNEKVFANE